LRQLPGVVVEEPETNLVFFDPAGAGLTALELIQRMRQEGIHLSLLGARVRACTHLDVTEAMIEEALGGIRRELNKG
jgi:threonine aldolase